MKINKAKGFIKTKGFNLMRSILFPYYMDFFSKHHRLEILKDVLLNQYYRFSQRPFKLDYKYYDKNYIPIIINNFNRFSTLKTLIDWLFSGHCKVFIIILDNMSTYPPLLQYYHSLCKDNIYIVRFDFNWGTNMILPIAKSLRKFDYYVATDPDLIPCNTCPCEILYKMKEVLKRYPKYNHVGASLAINNLPDHYPLKKKVLAWESKYWREKLDDDLYIAKVDTTFAMYKRKSNPRLRAPALRLGPPYTFQHPDWYEDPKNFSDEYKYYIRHCQTRCASWVNEMRHLDVVNESLGADKNSFKLFKSFY